MDVSHDSNGRAHMHDIALPHEEFFCLGADGLDDGLGQEFPLVQAGDAFVQIDGGFSEEKEETEGAQSSVSSAPRRPNPGTGNGGN